MTQPLNMTKCYPSVNEIEESTRNGRGPGEILIDNDDIKLGPVFVVADSLPPVTREH